MQKCPMCGYDEGMDWPAMLWVVSFFVLFVVFIFSADYAARGYWLTGYAAFLLFTAGTMWRNFRLKRTNRDFLTQHPSVTERIKAHISPLTR